MPSEEIPESCKGVRTDIESGSLDMSKQFIESRRAKHDFGHVLIATSISENLKKWEGLVNQQFD